MWWYQYRYKKPCGSDTRNGVSMHVFVCVCESVSACTGQAGVDRGDCFRSPYFYHITPTLKTDTCICNIQTRRMVLLLSLNFICGFWNHCNYDQPNTHLPNKAIFCVCVCVCACVGKDIHACTCMLHAAEWVLFPPPPFIWLCNLAAG